MILVDDPSAFPGDLLGRALTDAADPEARALWTALSPDSPPQAFTGPDQLIPFWHSGFLVAAPHRSQFDLLREFTATHESTDPVWCLAAAGTGCRGQHGRRWLAQPGNLHLSVALSAPAAAMEPGLVLNGLAVVATLDALRSWLPDDANPGIKWVNDLWLDGAKVGGVLTAVRRRPDRDEVHLGIGLNVAVAPAVSPDRFTPGITCLADHVTVPVSLSLVVPAVLEAVHRRWSQFLECGPAPLVTAYREACLVTGRRAVLWPDHGSEDGPPLRSGRVAGIDDDLGLRWEDPVEVSHGGRLALEEP